MSLTAWCVKKGFLRLWIASGTPFWWTFLHVSKQKSMFALWWSTLQVGTWWCTSIPMSSLNPELCEYALDICLSLRDSWLSGTKKSCDFYILAFSLMNVDPIRNSRISYILQNTFCVYILCCPLWRFHELPLFHTWSFRFNLGYI